MPSYTDIAMAKYVALGFTTGTVTDRAVAYLRSKGATGSFADMQKQKRTIGKVRHVLDPDEAP